MTMDPIDRFAGEFGFLSNFYPAPVTLDGVEYPTVEHAFQAAKTLDESERAWIRRAQTASIAKKRGREVALRDDWESIKVDVMRDLLRRKFAIPELKIWLRATRGRDLVEGNTWNDRFWGQVDGVGQNWLGRLLMEIREWQSE